MVSHPKTKASSLIVSAVALIVSVMTIDPYQVGVYDGAPLSAHLAYHWFHVSVFHALCNVWCFVSLVFAYNMSATQILASLAIASALPQCILTGTPTIGLSGLCFALMGWLTPLVVRKLYFFCWVTGFIAATYLLSLLPFFGGVSVMIHLYCYLAALTVSASVKMCDNMRHKNEQRDR